MRRIGKMRFLLGLMAILAMTGVAWALTETVDTASTYNVNNSHSAATGPGWNINFARNTAADTPVGKVIGGLPASSVIVQWHIDLNSTYYNTSSSQFENTINGNESTAWGAVNMNQREMRLQPKGYRWWNTTLNSGVGDWAYIQPTVGNTGDIFRLFDSTGDSGKVIIDTTHAKNWDSSTSYAATAVPYTGGTYLENGILEAWPDSMNPFGPTGIDGGAPSYGHPSGSVTMGERNSGVSRLNVHTDNDETIVGTLYGVTIPRLTIRNAKATLDADQNMTVRHLLLTEHATDFHIEIVNPMTVHVTRKYEDSGTSDKMVTVDEAGTLYFHEGVAVNERLQISLPTIGATFLTTYPGTHTLGKIVGGTAANIGNLHAYAMDETSGSLLTVRDQVTGNMNIDIPFYYTTVAVTQGSQIEKILNTNVLGLYNNTLNVPGHGGTLLVGTGGQSVRLLNRPGNGTPRLDIQDGATFEDDRTAANMTATLPPTIQYNGINGKGALTMTGLPTNLTLTPYLNSIYENNLQVSVTTVTLNANDYSSLSGTDDVDGAEVLQAFAGNTLGANMYNITKGIFEFYKPASIRNTNATVDLNVGTTAALPDGGINSTVIFRAGQVWDLTAANTTNPTVTAKFEDDATVQLPPTGSNHATNQTDLPTTPAAVQLQAFDDTAADVLNIVIDPSTLPSSALYSTTAGTGYLKLISKVAAGDNFTNVYSSGMNGATDVNISFLNGNNVINPTDIEIFVEDDYIFIGYPLKVSTPGGGGGTPTPDKNKVTLDMTDLENTTLSGGTLTVVKSGDKNPTTYPLSQYDVTIVIDPDDVDNIKQAGDRMTFTFNGPTIHSGAAINVSFEDADGNVRSFRTNAKIVDGKAVLDFQSFSLPSGTYKVTVSSPSGSNPFYTGTLVLSYEYVAPSGPVLYMFPSGTSNGTGINVYARLVSNDLPVANRDITFTLEVEDGVVVKGQTKRTNSQGNTDTVSYTKLGNATYYIVAKVDGIAYSFASPFVINVTSNPNPDPDPSNPTDPDDGSGNGDDSSGGGGCDAGFGALVALAGFALLHRKSR